MASSNASVIYAFLKSKGLGNAQIAGIMGNMQTESGFDPTRINTSEGAIGLCQWEGGRRTNLQALASRMGSTESDINVQLAFLWQELTGSYVNVLSEINGTSDPVTVAKYFDVGPGGANSGTGYENSSGDATSQREANASAIYAQLESGEMPTGGGTSTAGPGTTGHSTPAPYPSGSITGALTTAERTNMLAYLESWAGPGDSNPAAYAFALITGQSWATLNSSASALTKAEGDAASGKYDAKIISLYNQASKAGSGGPGVPAGYQYDTYTTNALTSWTDGLKTLLGWITNVNNWERIGLMVLGAVILLFAVDFMFGKNLPIPGV